MTSAPLLLTIDRGSATTAVTLLARVSGRWRLLGSLALPATIAVEAVIEHLVAKVRAADPDLAEALGVRAGGGSGLERVEVRSRPPGRLAVVSATSRVQGVLRPIVARSGWHAALATIQSHDPRDMTALLLESRIGAVLAAADARAGADERGVLGDLGALLGAIAVRRPDLPIVLSGALADQAVRIREWAGDAAQIVLAPDADAGTPAGESLRALLAALGRGEADARACLARGTERLAEALDRRVELLEIGATGGLRVEADPPTAGLAPRARAIPVAAAALVPAEIDDDVLVGVGRWSTANLDRHRLHDRLAELADRPWTDVTGEGARLRMAAARAALARLVDVTLDQPAGPAPDLVILAGGAWAVAPGPAISLAVADVVRRPGATQLAFDHARLLGPLGAIEDPELARSLTADLAGDLLMPLGALVIAAGSRPGKLAGMVTIRTSEPEGGDIAEPVHVELVPGGIAFVDLPPGLVGTAEFAFRDRVDLGGRGRRFVIEAAGGLGGMLIDLRDVPLRLPERQDLRRERLGSWQDALWPGGDR